MGGCYIILCYVILHYYYLLILSINMEVWMYGCLLFNRANTAKRYWLKFAMEVADILDYHISLYPGNLNGFRRIAGVTAGRY